MENDDAREKLGLAVAALQRGDKPEARRLLRALLSEDPANAAAWYWACQAGDTPAEQRYCLNRLLELDPENEPARRYLAQLTPDSDPSNEHSGSGPLGEADLSPKSAGGKDTLSFSIIDIFWGPIAFLLQLPPLVLAGLGLFLALILGVMYYRGNIGFFGLTTPDFASFRISEDCDSLDSTEPCWNIVYENSEQTVFAGKVRDISPIRHRLIPFMTHDILVTSGDFADPEKVDTGIKNHGFFWQSNVTHPEGQINLLHTVPMDAAIYEELLEIRSGDSVTITGREILKIEVYNNRGQGEWSDGGSSSNNTLRVTAVEILSP